MIRPLLTALPLLVALTLPAAASPNCKGGDGPGITVHIGVSVGTPFTEDEQEVIDKMRLRQAGIDADTVDRTWHDCLKVTRFENGRWVTEYYDPDTFERKPLNL